MALPFANTSEIVVLADFNSDGTYVGERTGTLASGTKRKPRYTIEIRSQPLLHNFDDVMLGAGPADAIRELIQDQVHGISEEASPGTQARRARAAIDFAAGKPEALKRYSGGGKPGKVAPGGRLGPMAPNQSRFKFNDSGRLAAGIFVMQNKKDATFTVNVPVNRLRPDTFGEGYQRMLADFNRLVPALNPQNLSNYKSVEDAIRKSINDLISRADNPRELLLKKLAAARKRFFVESGKAVFGGVLSPIR